MIAFLVTDSVSFPGKMGTVCLLPVRRVQWGQARASSSLSLAPGRPCHSPSIVT
jgi:hypothetical protein